MAKAQKRQATEIQTQAVQVKTPAMENARMLCLRKLAWRSAHAAVLMTRTVSAELAILNVLEVVLDQPSLNVIKKAVSM